MLHYTWIIRTYGNTHARRNASRNTIVKKSTQKTPQSRQTRFTNVYLHPPVYAHRLRTHLVVHN